MQQMDWNTHNIVNDNLEALKQLFPEAFCENKVDFEKLQLLLWANISNDKEKYSFSWKGKNDAIKLALAQNTWTLRPDKESSKNWDTTQNLYIEWDNLEVLRTLQDSYRWQVKMIYIDPPYNTWWDLIYQDDFSDNVSNYKEKAKENMKSNAETNGRYHTDWLNMMYPRLKLARNLLSKEWAIFISIDDNELCNLKKICDEIFWEENFVNSITVKMSEMKWAKLAHVDKKFPKIKEYLLIYAKNKNFFTLNPVKVQKEENDLISYSKYYNKMIINLDESPEKWKFIWIWDMTFDEKIKKSKSLIYLVTPDKEKDFEINEWTFVCKVNTEWKKDYFYNDWWKIKKVLFLNDNITTYLWDLWLDISTININKENYNIPTYSNWQKPLELLDTILRAFVWENDIVVDFFAWSGTTWDAVLRFNNKNNKSNKFILIQIPEAIEIIPWMSQETKKSVEGLINFLESINKPFLLTEIWKERIRRAWEKILEENKTSNIDVWFKVFKLDTTNLKKWETSVEWETEDEIKKELQMRLQNMTNPVKEDRTQIDMVYEIMLKNGMDLTLPMQELSIKWKKVFSIADNYLIACLEKNIDLETVKEIATLNPKVTVFYDDSFADDRVKINAIQNLEKSEIQVRVI